MQAYKVVLDCYCLSPTSSSKLASNATNTVVSFSILVKRYRWCLYGNFGVDGMAKSKCEMLLESTDPHKSDVLRKKRILGQFVTLHDLITFM